MNNKKGFTMVELLTVIIILSILALILMPIISGLVESSRKNAFKNSVLGIIDSASNYINARKGIKYTGVIEYPMYFLCNGEECKNNEDATLNFRGNAPVSGDIVITEDDIKAQYITFGKYCAYGPKWNLVIEETCEEIDIIKPVITGVQNEKRVTLTMSDVGSGIDSYCAIKNQNNSAGCQWITPTNINGEVYEIPSAGIWYFFAKDKKGNISDSIDFIAAPSLYCDYTPGEVVFYKDTTGSDSYTVPSGCNGIYKLETWGAQGGSCCYGGTGGKGGYARGNVILEVGETVYANVGGSGAGTCPCNNNGCEGYASAGGWTHFAKTNTAYASTSAENLYIASSAGGGGSCYRRWTDQGANVSYSSNGGSGGGVIGNVTDDETFTGAESMPTHDGSGFMTGNTGNGYVKISYVGPTGAFTRVTYLLADKTYTSYIPAGKNIMEYTPDGFEYNVAGMEFAGWTTDVNSTEPMDYLISNGIPVTLYGLQKYVDSITTITRSYVGCNNCYHYSAVGTIADTTIDTSIYSAIVIHANYNYSVYHRGGSWDMYLNAGGTSANYAHPYCDWGDPAVCTAAKASRDVRVNFTNSEGLTGISVSASGSGTPGEGGVTFTDLRLIGRIYPTVTQ